MLCIVRFTRLVRYYVLQYETFYIGLIFTFQDAFVGHIVENDVTIHGLTVRMDQLMEQNKIGKRWQQSSYSWSIHLH